jgi:hypothetical protein
VDCTLTEPSHMIGGKARGWQTVACTSAQAASRRGKLRSLLGTDRGFSGFREAGKSQQDVPSALTTCGIREGTCEEVSPFIRVGVG